MLEDLDPIESNGLLVDEVQQATWTGDDDVRRATQCALLPGDRNASESRERVEWCVRGEPLEHVVPAARVQKQLVVGRKIKRVRLDGGARERQLDEEHVAQASGEVGALRIAELDPPLLEPVAVEKPDPPDRTSQDQLFEQVVLAGRHPFLFERPALHVGVADREEGPALQMEIHRRAHDQNVRVRRGLPEPILDLGVEAESIADAVVSKVLDPRAELFARILRVGSRRRRRNEGGKGRQECRRQKPARRARIHVDSTFLPRREPRFRIAAAGFRTSIYSNRCRSGDPRANGAKAPHDDVAVALGERVGRFSYLCVVESLTPEAPDRQGSRRSTGRKTYGKAATQAPSSSHALRSCSRMPVFSIASR